MNDLNLYCIWRLRDHYRDRNNYSASKDRDSCWSVAREGENRDAFIARLIEQNIDSKLLLPNDHDSYTTFHIDYLFYSDDVETDIDIERFPAYSEKVKEAEAIVNQKTKAKELDEREIKRRQYERLRKEFESEK
jgi:aminoglycoside N3'-acetyltransferase